MNSGVYKIEHLDSGKSYIGSAIDINRRTRAHMLMLGTNTHTNCHLQSAWNKYGSDRFVFRTIVICSAENTLLYEQLALDGIKQSAELIAKRSAALMGHSVSERHRLITSLRLRGVPQSVALRAKLSAAKKGKAQKPEHVLQRSIANTGKKRSEETRARMREAWQRRRLEMISGE